MNIWIFSKPSNLKAHFDLVWDEHGLIHDDEVEEVEVEEVP